MRDMLQESLDLLIEFLAINGCSHAFNDLAFIVVNSLKKSAKNYKVRLYNNIFRIKL